MDVAKGVVLVCLLSCSTPTTVFAGKSVVICTAESAGPWKLLTAGTLNQTVTGNRTEFELQTPRGAISWSIGKGLDGSALYTAHFLMPVLLPRSHTVPRGPIVVSDPNLKPIGQFMSANGEIIQESDGNTSLISIPGSICPPHGYDARKSGARTSP